MKKRSKRIYDAKSKCGAIPTILRAFASVNCENGGSERHGGRRVEARAASQAMATSQAKTARGRRVGSDRTAREL